MKLPNFCYEKAFWIVVSVLGTVLMSVTGVVWGMIQDNMEAIHQVELQVKEDNVPELKHTVKMINQKTDYILMSQARMETKLDLLVPP